MAFPEKGLYSLFLNQIKIFINKMVKVLFDYAFRFTVFVYICRIYRNNFKTIKK